MNSSFWLDLLVPMGAAAGVYAAIKSDLTRAIVTAEMAMKGASSAHRRIDDIIGNHERRNHEQEA